MVRSVPPPRLTESHRLTREFWDESTIDDALDTLYIARQLVWDEQRARMKPTPWNWLDAYFVSAEEVARKAKQIARDHITRYGIKYGGDEGFPPPDLDRVRLYLTSIELRRASSDLLEEWEDGLAFWAVPVTTYFIEKHYTKAGRRALEASPASEAEMRFWYNRHDISLGAGVLLCDNYSHPLYISYKASWKLRLVK